MLALREFLAYLQFLELGFAIYGTSSSISKNGRAGVKDPILSIPLISGNVVQIVRTSILKL
jgi:hypothetical protein